MRSGLLRERCTCTYMFPARRCLPPRHAPPQVHLRMGSTRRARILLRACLGQLLANAPVQSQGEAWLAMAKCEMAEVSLEDPCSPSAKTSGSRESGGAPAEGGNGGTAEAGVGVGGTAQGEEALKRALVHLDRAIAMLKRCHDFNGLRECFYLKVSSLPHCGGRWQRRQGWPCLCAAGSRVVRVSEPPITNALAAPSWRFVSDRPRPLSLPARDTLLSSGPRLRENSVRWRRGFRWGQGYRGAGRLRQGFCCGFKSWGPGSGDAIPGSEDRAGGSPAVHRGFHGCDPVGVASGRVGKEWLEPCRNRGSTIALKMILVPEYFHGCRPIL